MKNLILCIFLTLPQFLFSQEYERFLKEFVAEQGKNDFKSKNFLDAIPQKYFVFGSRGVARAVFRFSPSCWYDWKLEDGTIDQDIHDWNYKIFGISPLLEPNNVNGLMGAARCLPDSFMMEFCIYQNINEDIFTHGPYIKFDIRKVYRLYIQFHKSKTKDKIIPIVWATDNENNEVFTQIYEAVDYKWKASKSIFLWHGGANNSPGKFGGPVSQKTTIYAKLMN